MEYGHFANDLEQTILFKYQAILIDLLQSRNT